MYPTDRPNSQPLDEIHPSGHPQEQRAGADIALMVSSPVQSRKEKEHPDWVVVDESDLTPVVQRMRSTSAPSQMVTPQSLRSKLESADSPRLTQRAWLQEAENSAAFADLLPEGYDADQVPSQLKAEVLKSLEPTATLKVAPLVTQGSEECKELECNGSQGARLRKERSRAGAAVLFLVATGLAICALGVLTVPTSWPNSALGPAVNAAAVKLVDPTIAAPLTWAEADAGMNTRPTPKQHSPKTSSGAVPGKSALRTSIVPPFLAVVQAARHGALATLSIPQSTPSQPDTVREPDSYSLLARRASKAAGRAKSAAELAAKLASKAATKGAAKLQNATRSLGSNIHGNATKTAAKLVGTALVSYALQLMLRAALHLALPPIAAVPVTPAAIPAATTAVSALLAKGAAARQMAAKTASTVLASGGAAGRAAARAARGVLAQGQTARTFAAQKATGLIGKSQLVREVASVASKAASASASAASAAATSAAGATAKLATVAASKMASATTLAAAASSKVASKTIQHPLFRGAPLLLARRVMVGVRRAPPMPTAAGMASAVPATGRAWRQRLPLRAQSAATRTAGGFAIALSVFVNLAAFF